MSEFESLIRVRRHEIEQKQKALAVLYKQAEDLKNKRDELETQRAIEAEKTKDSPPEMIGFFQPYADRVTAEIEEIDLKREGLKHKIRFAQDEMRDAFAEMKKIEIVDKRHKAEFLSEIERKEAMLMDEVAINAFYRKNKE